MEASGQPHAPTTSPTPTSPQESPQYPLNMRLHGPQSWDPNLDCSAHSLVTTDSTIVAHISFKEETFYAQASQVFITEEYSACK